MDLDDQRISEILLSIEDTFIREKEYILKKSVEEVYTADGKFLGDFVSFLMVDIKTTPPIFYSVTSPYDLISKKDPQHALVWQAGKLLLNTDYTDYAAMRTGAMDSIALKVSKVNSLKDKNLLVFGTGRTAKWSIRIMKVVFQDLETVNYINSTNTKSAEFEQFAAELGVQAVVGSKLDLKDYDIIICHTSADEPVLSMEEIGNIKPGAIITTFLSSDKVHGEVADGYYNKDANIVLDWKENRKLAKDLLRSGTPDSEIMLLTDLLANGSSFDTTKKYTIFRFVGTPMQNLGVLRELATNQ